MRQAIRLALFFVAVTLTVPINLVAGEQITGYGDFKFGMQFSDVASKAGRLSRQGNSDWYSSDGLVTVLGKGYRQSFRFVDNHLVTIALLREFSAMRENCRNEFGRTFAAVRA